MTEKLEGPYGTAELVPIPDIPSAAETVCTWLLTAPRAHPLWSQYAIVAVRLRDLPGFPPPTRQFDGATHELLVIALNPEHGTMTPKRAVRFWRKGRSLPYLTPVNIAHQIEGTDEEAAELAKDGARAASSTVPAAGDRRRA